MNLLKLFAMFVAVLAAGCAGLSREPTPEERAELAQVREDYAAGRYGDVIRRVARPGPLTAAPDTVRVEAYKLQTFSYCMSGYEQLCEDGFARIFAIDPSFALLPSEAGHPQWGPVYERVSAARGRPRASSPENPI